MLNTSGIYLTVSAVTAPTSVVPMVGTNGVVAAKVLMCVKLRLHFRLRTRIMVQFSFFSSSILSPTTRKQNGGQSASLFVHKAACCPTTDWNASTHFSQIVLRPHGPTPHLSTHFPSNCRPVVPHCRHCFCPCVLVAGKGDGRSGGADFFFFVTGSLSAFAAGKGEGGALMGFSVGGANVTFW